MYVSTDYQLIECPLSLKQFQMLLCYSEPESHPFIDAEEKNYLAEELDHHRKHHDADSRPDTPWKAIFTSPPVLALIWVSVRQTARDLYEFKRKMEMKFSYLVQCAYDWSHYVVTTDLPKYMNDVLHVSIEKNSIYSSLPRVISLVVALTAGYLCDWMTAQRDLTITNVRKTFIFLGNLILMERRVSGDDALTDFWSILRFE